MSSHSRVAESVAKVVDVAVELSRPSVGSHLVCALCIFLYAESLVCHVLSCLIVAQTSRVFDQFYLYKKGNHLYTLGISSNNEYWRLTGTNVNQFGMNLKAIEANFGITTNQTYLTFLRVIFWLLFLVFSNENLLWSALSRSANFVCSAHEFIQSTKPFCYSLFKSTSDFNLLVEKISLNTTQDPLQRRSLLMEKIKLSLLPTILNCTSHQ